METQIFHQNYDTMIEVFYTNVKSKCEEEFLLHKLHELLPYCKINFDLEDCDHILRIETSSSMPLDEVAVITMVKQYGYEIGVLPDESALTKMKRKIPPVLQL